MVHIVCFNGAVCFKRSDDVLQKKEWAGREIENRVNNLARARLFWFRVTLL
jgi:hypothetical protein